MRPLNRNSAAAYLQANGVAPGKAIADILKGFALDKPIYEHDFWPGDVVYQLVRRVSALEPVMTTGNWFGLAGVTNAGVAVNDGLAGRGLVKFEVVAAFKGLEGTAAPFAHGIYPAVGGPGGATQIYVPRSLLGHLTSLGPA